MTQTWIIFKIGDHKVHQMSDNGYVGKNFPMLLNLVDGTREMVAGEYKVSKDDVKVSFADEKVKPQSQTDTVVSLKVKGIVANNIKRKELKN